MDEMKWMAIAFVGLFCSVGIVSGIREYQSAQVEIEAIKAGLHEEIKDGYKVWVK